ncbi:MAG TPA: FAD:protein FMN transferase [bacterium]|nr:FAD:protein FMN transferase [bacterium]HQJ65590.1 FAD:protein FMN transferase [bacterium]
MDNKFLHFSSKAMATEFVLCMHHRDAIYAGQAAWEAFRLLEQIEAELSRYDPNSDIARLNALALGEALPLGEHTFACLSQANDLCAASRGAFDVTVGVLKDLWLPEFTIRGKIGRRIKALLMPTGMNHLHLSETGMTVRKDAMVQVDLGAIGKGYAVDRMVERLQEWEIRNFLLHGGTSSVAARGHAPGRSGWPVTLHHPLNRVKVLAQFDLIDRAMGASGVEKGRHIIDPRTRKPATGTLAAWVTAPAAAVADAFSTAFMVMAHATALKCIANTSGIGLLLLSRTDDGRSVIRHNFPLES